ncbi:hypothetical protein [Yersinia pestis]|nr:hypothetical protein [Yersinia pestis]ADV98196.1 hypothetical protein YPC_1578 [Yersinia pestis biovar Medievalis str. Harbin 35]EEO76184.1 hypothetical protein YP516_2381 [Yersinia pestis Nepal516]EEO80258.1 hypothetical protein YPF_3074 [Yersinia pestis biovar Orientalis str. India 195]EEO84492.1 hypothetical protein YPH_0305 [Yersinia pestis biovar Orientalis str. PEXU2]EEO89789.1 hypothetical protein YPS_3063 [Yersinia pestis Pestoides A]EIR00849.1 hypothetical protein YPPY04_2933 [Yer
MNNMLPAKKTITATGLNLKSLDYQHINLKYRQEAEQLPAV